ncbi:AraC-like DNA-binding protein [Bradyrhizobium sp. LB7.2]|jgi:AraC-like DNA-binding protein|uniref:AraC family transcriptional regulator n=1 Tax=Bradyrhizobium sp. LB14.3 TaxID=3156328 RepID=UPI003393F282
MAGFALLQTHEIKGFEEFREVVAGAPREVVQIQKGMLSGRLSHALIDGLRIDTASFNLGLRTKGVSGADGVVIGMLADSTDRVTRFSYESCPGDVLVTPPGTEHENRYYGGSKVIIASIRSEDISSSFACEGELSDPAAWRRSHYKGNAHTVQSVVPRLQSLVARLGNAPLTAESADFWKRAVIEAMSANIVQGRSSERDGPRPSALKIVRQVEEYLDEAGPGPVHISKICSYMHLPRRTLHRAFQEALGIGPIAFLKHRRLCSVHAALRLPRDSRTISDIALHYGFQSLGRFSGYYYRMFGEYPSETRRARRTPHQNGSPRIESPQP